MKGVYKRLKILEEIAEKAQRVLYEIWPGAGGLYPYQFQVKFYSDDDGESVGIEIQFDNDITPNVIFFEKVRKAVGADDIFLTVEDGIVTAIELYFKEGSE